MSSTTNEDWRRRRSSSSSSFLFSRRRGERSKKNCLICGVRFERKPMMMTIGEVVDEVVGPAREEFREALGLFWKMLLLRGRGRRNSSLLVEEEEEAGQEGHRWDVEKLLDEEGCGGGGGGGAMLWSPPSCFQCGEALVRILELQRVIDESLVEQRVHVKSLKGALESSSSSSPVVDESERLIRRSREEEEGEDFWDRVRRQLISCVVSTNINSGSCDTTEGGGGGGSYFGGDGTTWMDDYCPQDDDYDSLELDPRGLLEEHKPPKNKNNIRQSDDANPIPSGTPRRRGRSKTKRNNTGRSSREHQQKLSKVVEVEELKKDGGASRNDWKIRPCSVALERIDLITHTTPTTTQVGRPKKSVAAKEARGHQRQPTVLGVSISRSSRFQSTPTSKTSAGREHRSRSRDKPKAIKATGTGKRRGDGDAHRRQLRDSRAPENNDDLGGGGGDRVVDVVESKSINISLIRPLLGIRQSKLRAVNVIRKSLRQRTASNSSDDDDDDDDADRIDISEPPNAKRKKSTKENDDDEEFQVEREEEKMSDDDDDDASLGDCQSQESSDNSDASNNHDDDDERKWSCGILKRAHNNVKTGGGGHPPRRPKSYVFFLLGKDHLLYQNTTIRVSPSPSQGSSFTCLEEGCSLEVAGTGYDSFQRMRYHIMDDHQEKHYSSMPRDCVLCHTIFPDGLHLRNHLFSRTHDGGHAGQVSLVCEACWKPFPGLSKSTALASLKDHMRTHQSAQERRAEEEEAARKKAVGKYYTLQLQQQRRRQARKNDVWAPPASKVVELATTPPQSSPRVVWLVGEAELLFWFTSIRFSPTGWFQCQEPSCGITVEGQGTDYYSALQKIKEHVISSHSTGEGYNSRRHNCPQCQQDCEDGDSLRSHLLQRHHQSTHAICEACWKPITILHPKPLHLHMWSHKSAEEKAEEVASSGGPNLDREIEAKELQRQRLEKEKRKLDSVSSTSRLARIICGEYGVNDLRSVEQRNMFMVITESLLIHKFTVVRFEGGTLSCLEPECGEATEGVEESDFRTMRAHIAIFHEEDSDYNTQTRACPVCFELFHNPIKTFRQHMFRSHQQPTCICEICSKPVITSSGKKDDFRAHLWSHKNVAEHAASIAAFQPPDRFLKLVEAEKAGTTAGVEMMETLSTGRVEHHTCSECGKVLRSASGLTAHKETHLPRALRKQFQCDECGLSLLSVVALRSHVSRAHKPDTARKQRICPICDRGFHHRDGERWRTHVRSHTNERPFICEQCGEGFFNKGLLKKHSVSHTDVRLFQCEYCEMSYKYRKNLARHREASHKDKVPSKEVRLPLEQQRPVFFGPKIAFPCDHCDKVFPLRSRMTKHVKERHSGVEGAVVVVGGGGGRPLVHGDDDPLAEESGGRGSATTVEGEEEELDGVMKVEVGEEQKYYAFE